MYICWSTASLENIPIHGDSVDGCVGEWMTDPWTRVNTERKLALDYYHLILLLLFFVGFFVSTFRINRESSYLVLSRIEWFENGGGNKAPHLHKVKFDFGCDPHALIHAKLHIYISAPPTVVKLLNFTHSRWRVLYPEALLMATQQLLWGTQLHLYHHCARIPFTPSSIPTLHSTGWWYHLIFHRTSTIPAI